MKTLESEYTKASELKRYKQELAKMNKIELLNEWNVAMKAFRDKVNGSEEEA